MIKIMPTLPTRYRQVLAAIPSWYLVLVPSLLFLTNIGERAYQDVFFLVLLVYALVRGKADWSPAVVTIWGTWIAYIAWSTLTDSLGAGGFVYEPLQTADLILLLPWLVGWAREDNFRRPLGIGFRVALGVAGIVALYQVLVLGWPRASGSENALIFAALLSLYGIYVVYQTFGRERGQPLLWMVLTLLPITLSGSRAVIVATVIIFLLMSIRFRRVLDYRALVVGLIAVVLFSAALVIFAGKELSSRVSDAIASTPTSQDELRVFAHDFIHMEFIRQSPSNDQTKPPVLELKPQFATSIGNRLVYWRTGWTVFLSSPWLGVGSTQGMLAVGEALGMGRYFHDRHSHVHNTFLQHLVTGGIPKLVLLIAVLLLPIGVLARERRTREWRLLVYVTVALTLFGLTNLVLELTVVTFIYTLILAHVLAGRTEKGRETEASALLKKGGSTG
ncbi:MAG: O-antigen ligase family protein [Halothiobacillaceae bacterium]